MKIKTAVDRLIKSIDQPSGDQQALAALAQRLAVILDDPGTPLSNIDRVSRELRFAIATLVDGIHEDDGRGMTPEQYRELIEGLP